jgi:hypothetical protein
MAQKNRASNPAAGTNDTKRVRTEADPDCEPPNKCGDDFDSKVDLPGKTDSGPEPDVFGRDIPPQ